MYLANCYNLGDINVNSDAITYVGGLSGWFSLAGNFQKDPIAYVENCYNAGNINVMGEETIAGAITGLALAGNADDSDVFEIRNVYYSNTDLPCVGESSGKVRFENNTKLTDSEMKKKESFVGFNFVSVWGVDESRNDGYPYLRAFYNEIDKAELGDVNLDSTVNTSDAVHILKASAGMIRLDDEQVQVADMNSDGKINTADAVAILRYVAEM